MTEGGPVPEDSGQSLPVPLPAEQERGLAVQEPEFDRAVRELVALERERIDSTNRRTEVAVRAIEASDAADKRQYEYHVERLRRTTEERKERRRSVFRVVWASGSALALVVALLLRMLFFGTDAQREVAMGLMSTGLTALGGAGLWLLIRTLFQQAMSPGRDD